MNTPQWNAFVIRFIKETSHLSYTKDHSFNALFFFFFFFFPYLIHTYMWINIYFLYKFKNLIKHKIFEKITTKALQFVKYLYFTWTHGFNTSKVDGNFIYLQKLETIMSYYYVYIYFLVCTLQCTNVVFLFFK